MSSPISRAGAWFLRSGIQESSGGVARYYRADLERQHPVSTEITGYGISTLVYLHSLTKDQEYLDRAQAAARFLNRTAWDPTSKTMPFELEPAAFTYFFDCGIVIRGLLSAWRATGFDGFLESAAAIGKAMSLDFAADGTGDFHPVLALPRKEPVARDDTRWSRTAGCYQLKAAMAWCDLAEATGDQGFQEPYERVLAYSLRTWTRFLPGHSDRQKVMDRLHAFLYFLEGLLPRAGEKWCAAAVCTGIRAVEEHLRAIAPEFERSDVYAQLLRIRLYADWLGVVPLDRSAARFEARRLAEFQASAADPRIDGGFWFGRKGNAWLPYVNPVSTAFALQALALWEASQGGKAQPHRHLLI